MVVTNVTLAQFVEMASAATRLQLPIFQRTFNRSAQWCADLADTLYREWILGGITIWEPASGDPVPTRFGGLANAAGYLIDGNQRGTAICLLNGVRPGWLPEDEWQPLQASHEIFLQIGADLQVTFHTRAHFRDAKADVAKRWVALPLLLGRLTNLKEVAAQRELTPAQEDVLAEVRDALRMTQLPVFSQTCDPESAQTLFIRLNLQSKPVDPYATKLGFVLMGVPELRVELDALLRELAATGWGHLSEKAVWERFCDTLPRGFRSAPGKLPADQLMAAWAKYVCAVRAARTYLAERGQVGGPQLPMVLIGVFILLMHHFPAAAASEVPLHWLLRNLRSGRYVRFAALNTDKKVIYDAADTAGALSGLAELVAALPAPAVDAHELTELTSLRQPSPVHALLSAMLTRQGAADWITGRPLGRLGRQTWATLWPALHAGQDRQAPIAAQVLLDPDTAARLDGGFDAAVQADLQIPPARLAEQAAESPATGASVGALLDARAVELAQRINGWMAEEGLLFSAPAQLALADAA